MMPALGRHLRCWLAISSRKRKFPAAPKPEICYIRPSSFAQAFRSSELMFSLPNIESTLSALSSMIHAGGDDSRDQLVDSDHHESPRPHRCSSGLSVWL